MSNAFKDWYNDFTEEQKKNYELCMEYPFLVPTNRWTGKEVADYEYEYTELDAMPQGWRIAFGEQLCAELKEELANANYLENYRITDIKEKYGMLHWYDCGNTENGHKIIGKYEGMSRRICIHCGKPATKISTGWISPWCDTCANQISDNMVSIEEWFEEDVDGDN